MPEPTPPLRRFGSVDPFLEGTAWDNRMGRPWVNGQFLRALLQHGSFDAYDFFLPDIAYVRSWRRRLEVLVPEPALRARVGAFALTELVARLKSHAYAVFHQGDFTYFLPHLVALRQSLAGAKFVVTGVTHSLDNLHPRFVELAHAGLQPCDGIVCTSRAAEAVVQRKLQEVGRHWGCAAPPLHTAVIPFGVEGAEGVASPSPADAAAKEAARKELGLPLQGLAIVSLARLSVRSKNDWSPILEMLAPLHRSGALGSAYFVLAGGCDAQGRALLLQLCRRFDLPGRVHVLANLPGRQKKALLTAADIFMALVDNPQESFGVSVVEALCAGLPILAADYDGFRDSVRHGVDGLLVPTLSTPNLPTCMQGTLGLLDPSLVRFFSAQMTALDLAALQQALLQLLQQPALRQHLAAGAARRAKNFTWQRVICAYEAFWRHLGQQPQGALGAAQSARWRLSGEDLQAYAGHVAALLHPDDQLQATTVGAASLSDAELLTRYADLAALLPPALERGLLQACCQGPQAVHALRALGQTLGEAQIGDVDFVLLWLLKHGALARQPAAAVAP